MDMEITEEMRSKLEAVAELQNAFWHELTELESMTALEIDGTQDLEGMTVEDLYSAGERGED